MISLNNSSFVGLCQTNAGKFCSLICKSLSKEEISTLLRVAKFFNEFMKKEMETGDNAFVCLTWARRLWRHDKQETRIKILIKLKEVFQKDPLFIDRKAVSILFPRIENKLSTLFTSDEFRVMIGNLESPLKLSPILQLKSFEFNQLTQKFVEQLMPPYYDYSQAFFAGREVGELHQNEALLTAIGVLKGKYDHLKPSEEHSLWASKLVDLIKKQPKDELTTYMVNLMYPSESVPKKEIANRLYKQFVDICFDQLGLPATEIFTVDDLKTMVPSLGLPSYLEKFCSLVARMSSVMDIFSKELQRGDYDSDEVPSAPVALVQPPREFHIVYHV